MPQYFIVSLLHSFEKMVSGLYLGELVRLIVLKMAKQGFLFKGCVSKSLKTKGQITTEHVAAMEEKVVVILHFLFPKAVK